MFLDDAFIASIPPDPHLAGRFICTNFETFNRSARERGADPSFQYYETYLKSLALLKAICEINKIKMQDIALPASKREATDKITALFSEIRKVFDQTETDMALNNYRELLARKINSVFAYELSDGDIKRIQQLINELRDCISKTKDIEEEHRRRILLRLEKLQAELHKRISDLDRFWGLCVDASIVLAQVGENAKPIVDRVREIAEIIWNVQIRTTGLPSSTPLKMLSGQTETKT